MNPEKEKGIIRIMAIVLMFIYAIAVIVTCAAVWNSKQGAFPSICAVAVLAVSAYNIYQSAKKLKDYDFE